MELQNTKGFDASVELYKAMWEYVKSLKCENVYALEIVITFNVKHSKYPKFEMVENLENMRHPNFAGLRIIDGYTGSKGMREEFINEIRVESLPIFLQCLKCLQSTVLKNMKRINFKKYLRI